MIQAKVFHFQIIRQRGGKLGPKGKKLDSVGRLAADEDRRNFLRQRAIFWAILDD